MARGNDETIMDPTAAILMGVEPKIGVQYPKMDGENNGSKPYEQMDDLGGNTHIFGSTSYSNRSEPNSF